MDKVKEYYKQAKDFVKKMWKKVSGKVHGSTADPDPYNQHDKDALDDAAKKTHSSE